MKINVLTICVILLSLSETNSWWGRRGRRRSGSRSRRRSGPSCRAEYCRVGSWTSWSSCSHQCGTSGEQTRTRQLLQAASCGGFCSYNMYESRACNRDNCQNGGTPHRGGCSCRAGYGGTCCDQGESSVRYRCVLTAEFQNEKSNLVKLKEKMSHQF